jgi:methionyl aminopeptidase
MNESMVSPLRKAGAISGEARDRGAEMVSEVVTYLEVAEEVESIIHNRGAEPAFPVNISVNEIAAHYTPCTDDTKRFKKGDVVKIDVGAHVDGYIGDTAVTVEVGTRNYQRLIESSRRALAMALEMVGPGVCVSTLGGAIERSIKEDGYRPVVNLTGHGMERYCLHAGLTVPNVDDGNLSRIKKDMVVAIEPFATDGGGQVKNGRSGNIYRVLRERPMKDKDAYAFFGIIRERFNKLPFCERWCTAIDPNAPGYLRTLVRHGLVSSYPILNEYKKGTVSQAEHTVLVNGSKVEILTRTH